jgi:hypothetical protein
MHGRLDGELERGVAVVDGAKGAVRRRGVVVVSVAGARCTVGATGS